MYMELLDYDQDRALFVRGADPFNVSVNDCRTSQLL